MDHAGVESAICVGYVLTFLRIIQRTDSVTQPRLGVSALLRGGKTEARPLQGRHRLGCTGKLHGRSLHPNLFNINYISIYL